MKKYISNILFGRIGLFALVIAAIFGLATTLSDEFEIAKNLEIFSNVYRELNTYYVDEVDPEKVMRVGMESMLHSLDPYTTYIPSEEVEQFQSSISGHYGGVGASIVLKGDYVMITEVYEGSPAHKSGVRAGDQMISANGQSLKGLDTKAVSQKLRGAPGSAVKVEIQREGHPNPISMTITREEVLVSNLPYYTILDGDIGYIALTTFSENAGKNVMSAFMELRAKRPLKGVIIDLRGNSGGLLIEAVNLINVFVAKGQTVVEIKGKQREQQQSFKTLNNPIDAEIPLAVLINNGSASASEIVAGAIQDFDRGIVVGRKSYGKGLVQNTRDLGYGAKLKITTARYYVPSGRCIQSKSYKNGEPVEIADSLQEKFKTKNGRIVLDGGGIAPDIKRANADFEVLLRTFNQQGLIFDYAVQYRNSHPNLSKIEDLKLGDADFKDFLAFLDKKDYKHTTETEKAIGQLEKISKLENYQDLIKSQINELKLVVEKDKKQDLLAFKAEILEQLKIAIARNYFLEKGALQIAIDNDEDLKLAKEALLDMNRYKSILKKQ